MEEADINTRDIIGSAVSYWIMRYNRVVNRRSRIVYPIVDAFRESWLDMRGNSPALRALLEEG